MDKIDVSNLAQHFAVVTQDVQLTGGRYTNVEIHFEEAGLAKGDIHSFITPAMTLTQFKLQASRPLQMLDHGGSEEVSSAFVLSGSMDSHFHGPNRNISFNGRHHNLQYNTSFVADHFIRTPAFHAINISYNLDYLREVTSSTDHGPLALLRNGLEKREHFLASKESLHYSAPIADALYAIDQCVFHGSTRSIFIEGKMLELFALQTAQLQSVFSGEKSSGNWSNSDKEKLHELKLFVEANYMEPLSLPELTRKFSLNEFKLKKGYKQLFSETVFGNIHRLRMQKAKELLLEKEMNVTEVSYFIGYENVSSFSAAFKKHFGYNAGSATAKKAFYSAEETSITGQCSK